MNRVSSFRLWTMMIALLFGMSLAACSEKPAQQPIVSSPNQQGDGKDPDGDGDGDSDGDSDGDGDGGPTTSSYDLCEALEDESDLSKWQDFVNELCDEGKLDILRKSDNVYSGGSSAKVALGPSDENGNEVSFRLFSSSRVPTSADKYYQMLNLQFFEPTEFDENFERDKHVEKYEIIDSSSTSVEYEYLNTKESASAVHYIAKSYFIELEKNQAYVVAAELIETKETMEDLQSLIIVNKISSSRSEVFVISDQTYDKGNQETSVARANAKESLEEEQIRSYKNAEKADDYFD